jgi:hypothetical protein
VAIDTNIFLVVQEDKAAAGGGITKIKLKPEIWNRGGFQGPWAKTAPC